MASSLASGKNSFQACPFSRQIIFFSLNKKNHDNFKTQDVENHTIVTSHPSEKSYWTQRQTDEEKLDLLKIDVSGNVDVFLYVAEFHAGGSFGYLDEKQVKFN